MTLNEYQDKAMTTCTESSNNDTYALFGLMAEVGELADKIAKAKRKEVITIANNEIMFSDKVFDNFDTVVDASREVVDFYDGVKKELGDILWFVALNAKKHGFTLDEVAQTNLYKLAKRKAAGTIIEHEDH